MFENITAAEMVFVIEPIMDRGVDGGVFLKGTNVPERRHRFLPSSEWFVRVLGPIVKPTTAFLAGGVADHFHRRTICRKWVRDDGFGRAATFHRALQKLQRSLAITAFRDKDLKDLAFVINGPP